MRYQSYLITPWSVHYIGVPRLEAHWYIDFHERSQNMNPTLLKLAKFDFNIVQVAHQDDLKYVSR